MGIDPADLEMLFRNGGGCTSTSDETGSTRGRCLLFGGVGGFGQLSHGSTKSEAEKLKETSLQTGQTPLRAESSSSFCVFFFFFYQKGKKKIFFLTDIELTQRPNQVSDITLSFLEHMKVELGLFCITGL